MNEEGEQNDAQNGWGVQQKICDALYEYLKRALCAQQLKASDQPQMELNGGNSTVARTQSHDNFPLESHSKHRASQLAAVTLIRLLIFSFSIRPIVMAVYFKRAT